MIPIEKRKYFGSFNRNGYEINYPGNTSDPIYQASNCKYDSGQYLPPDADGSLDIATIEEFCDSTGKQIAEDNGGEWIGCHRVDDFDDAD